MNTRMRQSRIFLRDGESSFAAALADHGHVVDVAADGPAALALLERAQHAGEALPEVAAIDFAMPGMTGAELAAHLARRFPALRVVFMSGFADLAAIEAVAGPDAVVLRKPFATEQLISAVARAA